VESTKWESSTASNKPLAAPQPLAELCTAIGGRRAVCGFAVLADPSDVPVGPIASDSRMIEPGDVFWALHGPNHRGEDFIGEAFCRGAVGAVVNKDVPLDFSSLPLGEGLAQTPPLSLWERGSRRPVAGLSASMTRTGP